MREAAEIARYGAGALIQTDDRTRSNLGAARHLRPHRERQRRAIRALGGEPAPRSGRARRGDRCRLGVERRMQLGPRPTSSRMSIRARAALNSRNLDALPGCRMVGRWRRQNRSACLLKRSPPESRQRAGSRRVVPVSRPATTSTGPSRRHRGAEADARRPAAGAARVDRRRCRRRRPPRALAIAGRAFSDRPEPHTTGRPRCFSVDELKTPWRRTSRH